MADSQTKAALIVVDLQEDFCPPKGSLAVPNGRDVIPVINALLRLPFVLKVATKDWHPPNHISFAENHPGKTAFKDTCRVTNPHNEAERYDTRLWPVHCVQNTPGAALVSELAMTSEVRVLEKGTDPRVEMYSAFYPPLRNPCFGDSGLAAMLQEAGVTTVYVVGLAADYCVKSTALDARAEGFDVILVEDGTKPVDADQWKSCREEMMRAGVRVVKFGDPEVRRLSEG